MVFDKVSRAAGFDRSASARRGDEKPQLFPLKIALTGVSMCLSVFFYISFI